MTPNIKIIPEEGLKDGWYRGHADSRFPVAYWDSKQKEFVTLTKKINDEIVTKAMNHWNAKEFAAFGPVEFLGE